VSWPAGRKRFGSCWSMIGLLLALHGGAVCQEMESRDSPECGRAADRLRSESPREKAWGAHWAGACQTTGLAGEIEAELAKLNPESLAGSAWDSESFWLGHSILDSLIQLRQPAPASLLESIAKAFPVEGTIAAHARPGGAEWVAASNALARLRTPGFAAVLLTEIPLTHSVWVSDTDRPPGRGIGGSLGSGSPTLRVPLGFPPTGFYRLTGHPAQRDELASDGAIPIYLQRIVMEPGQERTLSWPPEGYCARCLEIGYLADLARASTDEVDRAVEPQTAVRWTNLFKLNSEVAVAITNQQSALRQLAKSLMTAGAIERSELAMSLHIEVMIEDQRSDRSTPLPKFPPVEFRLR
jgi:hypothetical protein